MSWISEFAGRAENFLNKIDQNAAVALSSADTDSSQNSLSKLSSKLTLESVKPSKSRQGSNSLQVSESFSTESFAERSGATDFSAENHGSFETTDNFSVKLDHSKSQSSLPNRVKPSRKTTPRQNAEPNPSTVPTNGHFQKAAVKSSDQELLDFLNSPEQKDIDVNSLMKTELDTQKREMSLLLQKNRKLLQDNESLRNSIESNRSRPSSSSRSNPRDLTQENQIEREETFTAQIAEKEAEITRLTERLDQALEKLEHTGELQVGQNRIQVLERENRQLSTKCQEFEKNLDSAAAQIEGSEKQNKSMKDTITSLELEFASYKDKAKIILKHKDDLITSIKTESRNDVETDDSLSTGVQFLSEIGALRNERELLHAEITQSRSYIESMREENKRVEEELQSLRTSNSNLHKLMSKEKQKYDSVQEDNLQLSQEISSLQLMLERERIEARKAREKMEKFYDQNSNSVLSLGGGMTKSSSLGDFAGAVASAGGRPQIMQSNANTSGYSDMSESENLRTRITALSQSLLEKQGLINSLSSDKQLLQIRCERLQGTLEELNYSSDSFGSGANITQSVVSSQPLYLSESPWDSRMATRVKRAYSVIDSFCCEVGLVLRQRPNLRLGFCVYILCLHLWVFLILFTWAHHTSVSGTPAKK